MHNQFFKKGLVPLFFLFFFQSCERKQQVREVVPIDSKKTLRSKISSDLHSTAGKKTALEEIQELSQREPQSALDELQVFGFTSSKGAKVFSELIQKLWLNDREILEEYIKSAANDIYVTSILNEIFEHFLDEQPMSQWLTWVNSLTMDKEGGRNLTLKSAAIKALVKQFSYADNAELKKEDFALISEEVKKHIDDPEFDSALPDFGETFVQYFPDESKEFFESLPAGSVTMETLHRMISELARGEKKSLALAEEWLSDPADFADFYFLNDEIGINIEESLKSENPDELRFAKQAVEWAEKEGFDRAVGAFLDAYMSVDPEKALSYAERIHNPELKEDYLQQVQHIIDAQALNAK